jgi:UDP-glucose 4-epimerase
MIAVFGAGLLGSSIAGALSSTAPMKLEQRPLSWTEAALQARQLQDIEETISAALGDRSQGGAKATGGVELKVLWSAGRAGFTATDAETAVELAAFRAVLGTTEGLTRRFPGARVAFFLLSSAGGLFEGQRHVVATSRPQPSRPYGVLKKTQEELLAASESPMTKRVYRLTSVYGYLLPNHRIGLISTLILNAVRHRVTSITACMSTLRDFIFIEDVARFLGRRLLEDTGMHEASTAVLANAKPCSLFEIQRLVESVVRRRIYVSYSLDPSNREDITLSPSVLPPDWQPSDLRSNIGRIYRQAVASGAAFQFPPPRSGG